MPVIGFLHSASPDGNADRVRTFRQGLKETGFVEGENVAIEYRWADSQVERLPALATELVRRGVAVIVVFWACRSVRGQGGNHDNPNCLCRPRGPGQAGPCHEPGPAGRQLDGDQFLSG